MRVKLNPDTGCSEVVCPYQDKPCGVCGAFYSQDVMSSTMYDLFDGHYEKVYWADGNEVRFTREDKDYKVAYFQGYYYLYLKYNPVSFEHIITTGNKDLIRCYLEHGHTDPSLIDTP